MAMLRFLIRKMWNTRWLTASALLGLVVAVAFTTSIPMYADGALKRVVAKSLQEKSDGLPAGSIVIRYQAAGAEKPDLTAVKDVDAYIRDKVPGEIGFPVQTYASFRSIRGAQITPVDPKKVDPSKRRQMTLAAMDALAEHAEFSAGRPYADTVQNGAIEAVVFEEALYRNDIHVGDEFNYPIAGGLGIPPLKVKVVGAFKVKQEGDPYWFQGFEGLLGNLLVSDKLFQEELLAAKKIPLNLANWFYAFDLREIKTSQIDPLEGKLKRLDINLFQKLKDTKVDISFLPMLEEFKKQSVQLQILLFTLAAPMLGMVIFYIVLNARQALERQRSDIAVIRSRGGSTGQIIWIYVLESLLLGAAALAIGPAIGWFMAKSIGSSSGFLTFVDRKSIPVGFQAGTLLYGLAAVLLAMLATVLPAVQYARSSIVSYKQKLARSDSKPFWMRWFLDLALLGLAGYGWYLFQEQQLLSEQTGLSSDELQVQPLLFFVPALAIFALGLFFLRVFPWLLMLASKLGKSLFPVSIYLTLAQLSRSARSYYPLMLLLILTLGLGMYNASAARTIDLNSTERLLYQYGTDVIIQPVWESVSDDMPIDPNAGQSGQGGSGGQSGGRGSGGQGQGGSAGGFPGTSGGAGGQGGAEPPAKIRYIEPPFEVFRSLAGVEYAARVLQVDGNVVSSGKSLGVGRVMAIDNVDFAKVAWFRKDLFPAHPYQYLNLLGLYDQAVIIPSSFAERNQLKTGDLISIAINQQQMEFVIVGILPYWPSQYPDQKPFFIANLEYIFDQAQVMRYDVWLKMKDGARVAPLVEQLKQSKIELAGIKDVRNELITQKKHPARGGVFGILSLGFLVSVLVSLIGYILYWFFNLSSRVVQFGVLRAMGLKRAQLTGMLLLEQLFTAGLSIGLGIGIGKLVSYWFLPFLQTAENVKTQVPPFRVVFEAKDAYQLYFVTLVMVITGAGLLLLQVRRLRVHQAVKMGEER